MNKTTDQPLVKPGLIQWPASSDVTISIMSSAHLPICSSVTWGSFYRSFGTKLEFDLLHLLKHMLTVLLPNSLQQQQHLEVPLVPRSQS